MVYFEIGRLRVHVLPKKLYRTWGYNRMDFEFFRPIHEFGLGPFLLVSVG